jgi:hypothetical protein
MTTAMMSWFTNIHSMTLRMRQLEARVEELEGRLGAPVPTRVPGTSQALLQAPVLAAVAAQAETSTQQSKPKKERKQRRERKITDVLREGETIFARIPLGNRLFHESEITYTEGAFHTEDLPGTSLTNLNKMLVALAKKLEEDEIRDPAYKSPLNAWLICSVSRGDKKVLLDKATEVVAEEAEEVEEAEEEKAEEE